MVNVQVRSWLAIITSVIFDFLNHIYHNWMPNWRPNWNWQTTIQRTSQSISSDKKAKADHLLIISISLSSWVEAPRTLLNHHQNPPPSRFLKNHPHHRHHHHRRRLADRQTLLLHWYRSLQGLYRQELRAQGFLINTLLQVEHKLSVVLVVGDWVSGQVKLVEML